MFYIRNIGVITVNNQILVFFLSVILLLLYMNYRNYLGYGVIILIGLIVTVGFIIIGIVGIQSPQ